MGYGPSPRILAGVATVALGLGVMGAPAYARSTGPVTAQTPQQQIKKLQEQIRQLKNQLAIANAEIAQLKGQSTTTAPGTTAPAATPTTTAPTQPVPEGQPSNLAGNVRPTFPQGTAGQVALVYSAPVTQNQNGFEDVPFVVRNNTSKPVTDISVATTVLSGSTVIASGQGDDGTNPIIVEPGEWALGYIDYSNTADFKSTDKVQYSVQSSPTPDPDPIDADVTVTQANNVGQSITGLVKNTAKTAVEAPIQITAYCFNSAGKPNAVQTGDTNQTSGNIAVGATSSYEIDLFNPGCKSLLVGGQGLLPIN